MRIIMSRFKSAKRMELKAKIVGVLFGLHIS